MTVDTPVFTKAERISLRDHPSYNERWLQDRIANDPAILGLGDSVLLNKELIQPKAGRLDLLLGNPQSNQRFEVEIQLGRTDETHIIRTIEYWDIERKRYPQYDHTAVIVAEDITSRFLNVIGLFNGFIPLVALQVSALRVGDHVTLVFTRVLDRMELGPIEIVSAGSSRVEWEKWSGKDTLGIVDEVMQVIKEIDSSFEPKYNKQYIGLARNGQPDNFVVFQPQKKRLRLEIVLAQSDEVTNMLQQLNATYNGWGYLLFLEKGDVVNSREVLSKVLKRAFEEWG